MKIGAESVRVLEASLIRELRSREEVSRIDLARRMELAPSTVGQYIDRLIHGGYVLEGRKAISSAGRPPIVLELNPNAGYFVGIDFDGRQMQAVAVDFAQRPLRQQKLQIQSTDDSEQVLVKMEGLIRDLMTERAGPLLGIGVAVPGTVDPWQAVGLHYHHIRGWQNVPIGERLASLFHVPIHIENNIRAMALAEQLFGEGWGIDDFICLGIRSGIGAGLVINGQLHHGPRNLAGEIGGWTFTDGATLERQASLIAIEQQVALCLQQGVTSLLSGRSDSLSADQIIEAAQQGDQLVLGILQKAGEAVGQVISQFSLLLDPEKVIIAGPLGELEQEFINHVREEVRRRTLPPQNSMLTILGSQLGEFGGALGGAALTVQQWEPSRETNGSASGSRTTPSDDQTKSTLTPQSL